MFGALRSVGVCCALVAGATTAAGGQAASPQPVAPACTAPDAPARLAHRETPVVPAQAVRYGVGGHVAVAVKLDGQGRVDAATATSYSSGFFVRSAVAAARASTYVPAVRDCAPVASTYLFEATYDVPDYVPPLRVDPLTYLPGAWRCAAVNAAVRTIIFVRNGNALDEMVGAGVTSLALDRYRMWRISGNQAIIGWAYPWVDDTWTWSAHGSSEPRIQFRRIDDSTLVMTSFAGTAVPRSEVPWRCARAAAAP